MKVLHINCNYIGSALHQTMIEHLDSMGLSDDVFVPTYDPEQAVIQPGENVCVSKCFRKWDRIIFKYKQRKIISSLEHEYNVENYDLIHAYTLFTDGNVALNAKKKYGAPYVVAIRNTDVNSFFKIRVHLRELGLTIMKEAEAVFFLSPLYKELVFNKYVPKEDVIFLEKKTYVIPNGIDDFWLENKYCDKEAFSTSHPLQIIYAGRIDANKNIETTQKALENLREQGRNCELTVVGKIDDRHVFNKIIRDKHTQYIEAQPKEQLIEYYRKNDIFVMPSFRESFGLGYAEAMSQGLPVIYTKGQGFDGQFKEGEVGFAVDASSSEKIMDKIKEIEDQYDVISKSCLERVNKFNWDGICKKYKEIYEKICVD